MRVEYLKITIKQSFRQKEMILLLKSSRNIFKDIT